MSEVSPESAERARAIADLEDIERLKKSPAFQRYFQRRIIAERDKAQGRVLSGRELSQQDLRDALVTLDVWKEVATLVSNDETSCRNILAQSPPEEEA